MTTPLEPTLPGGDQAIPQLQISIKNRYPWLEETLIKRWSYQFGTRVWQLLESVECQNDLGEQIDGDLYAKEVIFYLEQEWALTADDILWRRSKLGLTLSKGKLEDFLLKYSK